MLSRTSVAVMALIGASLSIAQAQIPNSAMPGREREQMLGKRGPQWGVPQIELQNGRPRPVFEVQSNTRPVKRRKVRGKKR